VGFDNVILAGKPQAYPAIDGMSVVELTPTTTR